MQYKTESQRMRERFEIDGIKIFRHFCLLPRTTDDTSVGGDVKDRVNIWFGYCYKVLCWQTHGMGGNSYWHYFKNIENARKCMEDNVLY